jgi:cell cycle sensor histidine kinase DivJ
MSEEVKPVAVVWMVQDEADRVLRKRRAFRKTLQDARLPAIDLDASELIYGELVANTVRYANGKVVVKLEMHGDDPVLVVRDHGPGLRTKPPAPGRQPFAESGRGLAIVEILARDLAVDIPPSGGTEIRATLPTLALAS